ncbi:uncharacterized protein HD556DRAFT_1441028 [Suillus plorans]|uniref:Uncharacterized protein n=1 Tax=Suillus plorans TaxID=116603 RepID=A0A9P7ASG7_9AGAM|nr:uncharacterized protein HD556DRAFT_1442715 [Suillus plorans]XP_041162577.1 uncharacterized protein HD556DRAFT_1441028 [Suillus plorans]KAG1794527.1 hypothetical protein HD556DRAFT_1442715 [Suillus plorans]KAG1797467.1 hypothetical protein HD556DRAFT_1441028 [Suillus plorans]
MKTAHLFQAANLAPSSEREASLLRLARQQLESDTLQVDNLAAELFAITLTDNDVNPDSHSKLWNSCAEVQQEKGQAYHSLDGTATFTVDDTQHIAQALQAAEKRRCSKAQEALDIVESRMDRAHSRIFSVTSRDVMQTIRDELAVITTALRIIKHKVSCIVSRRSQLEGSCNDMHRLLCDKEDVLSVSSKPIEFDSSHHFDLPINLCDKVAQISLFLGAVSVVIFGISRRHGEFFMGVLALILGLAMEAQNPHSESRRQNTHSQIPRSMETALSCFKLDGQTTAYAVCPACNCTYRPTTSFNSSHARYPTKCFNCPIPEDGPCDKPLLQPSADGKLEPIKIFLYHHFHDYLAGLLSRPDLEVLMDRPCNDLLVSIGSPPHIIKDVWDANFFCTFKGPSGQSLFIDRGTEGRYAFTLNIEGNLQ